MPPAFKSWEEISAACKDYVNKNYSHTAEQLREDHIRSFEKFIAFAKEKKPLAEWTPNYFAEEMKDMLSNLTGQRLKVLANLMFPYQVEFDLDKQTATTAAQAYDMQVLKTNLRIHIRNNSSNMNESRLAKLAHNNVIEPFYRALLKKGVRYQHTATFDSEAWAKIQEVCFDIFTRERGSLAYDAGIHLYNMLKGKTTGSGIA